MVMFRRELPLTKVVGWAVAVPHRSREDSPHRAPLDRWLSCSMVIVCQLCASAARSTVTPMSQMKPSNSRPTATTTFCFGLPLATRRM